MADTLEAMNPQYPPAEEGLEHIVISDWTSRWVRGSVD
jgi:hypothetical protein